MFFQSFLDERDRWFLWLPVFIAGGTGFYFSLEQEPSVLWFFLSPLFLFLLIGLRHKMRLLPALAAFFVFSLGFNAAQMETRLAQAPMIEEKTPPLGMTGRLVRAEPLPDGRTRVLLKDLWLAGFEKEKTPFSLQLKTALPLAELPPPGSVVSAWGPLWPPGEAVAPGAHDVRRTAFFKRLGGYSVARGPLREQQAAPPPSFRETVSLWFEDARQALLRTSFSNLSGERAAMTAALLAGTQAGMKSETLEAMRVSGLFHLLSISGIHVGMFALLIYVPLRFLLALWPWAAVHWPIKKIAAAAAIPATVLYVLLVGPETPTVRSALMATLVLLAVIADRKPLSLRLVVLASLPIMLLAPSAVMGPSFQMSFMAVLAIVALYEKRPSPDTEEKPALLLPFWLLAGGRWGRDIVLTSLAATLATLPFTVFHFQTFAFYGVATNMVVLPLTSFWIMPCLLLSYLSLPFGLESPFVKAAGAGVDIVLAIAHKVSTWPLAQVTTPPLSWTAFLLSVLGVLWFCLWQGRWRFVALVPFVAAGFCVLATPLPDAFVSADGKAWVIRLPDASLVVYGEKRATFLTAQWQRLAFARRLLFLSKEQPADILCTADYCSYEKIFFLLQDMPLEKKEALCHQAAVLVSPFPMPPCEAHVITPHALRTQGGHALFWRSGPLRLETVRTEETKRPWSLFSRPFLFYAEPPR